MKIHPLINFLILLLVISACSKARPSSTPLNRSPFLDLGSMNGNWHVVGRIPTIFDRDASEMGMSFRIRQDYSMEIDWQFKRNPNATEPTKFTLSGQAGRGRESTIWKVTPFWPLSFTYQVLEFSGDYSWIVVGSTDRRYLWILSRSEKIDPLLLDGLLRMLEKSEFDLSSVIRSDKAT